MALIILVVFTSCSKDEVLNVAPIITAQSFTVEENVSDNFVIGTLVATDVNQDPLKFSLKTDDANFFEITENGEISLLAGKNLDFETKNSYTITAEVTDGVNTADAQVTINVSDVAENTAPVIAAQTFDAFTNMSDTDIIGRVVATDAENDNLTFSIPSQPADSPYAKIFEITADGDLSLKPGESLPTYADLTFKIVVAVSDGELTSAAIITINSFRAD